MSCFCTKTNPIPTCVENLTIGAIADVSTAVYIYFNNLATGRKERISAVSDVSGLIIADVSAISFTPAQTYELYVTLANSTGIADNQPITIGTEQYDCLQLHFVRVYNNAFFDEAYSDITLDIQA